MSDTIARVIELPMGGSRAAENARGAVQRKRVQREQIELTLAQHRKVDAIALSLGQQAMQHGADPEVVGTIFDLMVDKLIAPDAGRGLLGELTRNPDAGDEVLKLLEPERIERSKSNHPARVIHQVTVPSV